LVLDCRLVDSEGPVWVEKIREERVAKEETHCVCDDVVMFKV
jgi:hypothetical protein